ncbi:MAG: metal ABC transporter solute-binding protein, Zn/Mn family [Trueperaceae bacterium]
MAKCLATSGKARKKKIKVFLLFLLSPVSCLFSPAFAQLNAVVTVGMLSDVVQNVGGDCVNVTTLMGPGIDPHLYKAGARDVHTLQNADVIFYSGYHLEGQLGEVLEAFQQRKPTVAVAEKAIPETETLREAGVNAIDPHLWMDAQLWSRTADVIAQTLSELSSECQNAIANAEVYKVQLEALHTWIKESIRSIPEAQRVLVTAHDAFFYYSRAYGIDVASVQGVSTQAEASIEDIRSTVKTIVARNIPAIFVESSINPRTIDAVLQAARSQGIETKVGGSLFSDALGEAGTANGTYIGMLYHNTKTIVESLSGKVAPLPSELDPWLKSWNL